MLAWAWQLERAGMIGVTERWTLPSPAQQVTKEGNRKQQDLGRDQIGHANLRV